LPYEVAHARAHEQFPWANTVKLRYDEPGKYYGAGPSPALPGSLGALAQYPTPSSSANQSRNVTRKLELTTQVPSPSDSRNLTKVLDQDVSRALAKLENLGRDRKRSRDEYSDRDDETETRSGRRRKSVRFDSAEAANRRG